MFRVLAGAALALLLLLAGAAPPRAAAQEVTLKVAHFLPPASTAHAKFIAPWCEKIARESNNRLRCQIFPAMQLGGTPPQLFDQVRDGVADIVWTLPGYNAGRFPIMEVFELPFMTNNAESASKAVWEFYEKNAVKEFDAVKPLAFHVHDNGYIHTRDRPIRTLEDFRGMKVRAPTRMTNRMLAAFGATPVSMPVPALADALSKGVIDGAVIPWEVVPSVKVHEMVRFHAETDPAMPALYTAVFLFAMNKATNVIPATELARWDKAARGLYAQWISDMNNRGLNGSQLMTDARQLIAKHGKAAARPAAEAGRAPVKGEPKK